MSNRGSDDKLVSLTACLNPSPALYFLWIRSFYGFHFEKIGYTRWTDRLSNGKL